MINVEDIYFLTGLSRRGILVSFTGPRGGDMSIDDLIDEYCVVRTRSQGGKILIKNIMDRPLRTVAFTIEKVAGSLVSHHATKTHMMYALECMSPTIFNWSEGLLVILEDQLTKCRRGDLK